MGVNLSKAIDSVHYERHGNEYFRVCVGEMWGQRKNQEDQHTINLDLGPNHPGWSCFGVFDGHGGTGAAEFCKREVPKRMDAMDDPSDPTALTAAIVQLDLDYCEHSSDHELCAGCTFLLVLLAPNGKKDGKMQYKVTVANVGDSRAILITSTSGTPTAVDLTTDHDPASPSETARIEKAGGVVKKGRVNGDLAMSRSIGDYRFKCNPNKAPLDQIVIPLADITTWSCQAGDILLLACDGMFERLYNCEVARMSYDAIARQNQLPCELVNLLIHKSLHEGSRDNMTCMVVHLTEGTDYVAKMGGPHTFIPGKIRSNDENFLRLYVEDALHAGIGVESLLKQIRRQHGANGASEAALETIEQIYDEMRNERECADFNTRKVWTLAPNYMDDRIVSMVKVQEERIKKAKEVNYVAGKYPPSQLTSPKQIPTTLASAVVVAKERAAAESRGGTTTGTTTKELALAVGEREEDFLLTPRSTHSQGEDGSKTADAQDYSCSDNIKHLRNVSISGIALSLKL